MLIAAVTAVAFIGVPLSAAFAQSNVAVVNIQAIMRDSMAAKSVREQLEQKQKSFQGEIGKKEEQLQKEDQELAKQRSVLAKDAFEKKLQEFRGRATKVQKEVQSKKALLDGAFERSIGQIQKAVTDIIAAMAKEKQFTVAIPTSQVLYAEPALDITDEVLKRLDKDLPRVDVKFEEKKKEDAKP